MKHHKSGSVRLSVDTGYDTHSMVMSQRTWKRIQSGASLSIKGQGFFIEGEKSQDVWSFNLIELGSVAVEAEDGFDVFSGTLSEVSAENL